MIAQRLLRRQPGGRKLREAGVNLKSLAIVTSIQDGRIQLADDD